jgi:L-alanine-DL-glutamate epimerase-like enolase superfamily enzyme
VSALTTACLAMVRYERAVLFVPHGWNTAVGLAADLQLVAAVPVARWVEYITPAPYIEDLVSGKDSTCKYSPSRQRALLVCARFASWHGREAIQSSANRWRFVSLALHAGNPFGIDEDGLMSIPTGPGLGISWDDAGILEHTGLKISSQITGVVEPMTRQVLSCGTSGESSHKQRQRL